MTDSSTKDRGAMVDAPAFAAAVLALASLVVAIASREFWDGMPPLGADASSHIATIATFADRLATGEGWWSNDYNLGFPLGLYYQPLPHLVSATLCTLLGGPEKALAVFKVLLALALVAQPWAVYAGMRRAGFRRSEAAAAGFLAPFILDGIEFGYHAQGSLGAALYTQAWGNLALPLVFGELAAIARSRGDTTLCAMAAAFTASTHMFYAIALLPVALLMALVGGDLRRAIVRMGVAGLGAFCLLAAWLVPLVMTQSYFGGWPFGVETRVNGYGFGGLFERVIHGSLLDADRPPFLLLLAAIGLAVTARRSWREPIRDRAASRALIALIAWAAIGVIGRAGLGSLIDLYPPHSSVQLFRYGALLQFGLICACGVALGQGMREVAFRWGGAAALAFGALLTLAPIINGVAQLADGFRTMTHSRHIAQDPYFAAADFVASLPSGGRMFVGSRSGLRGHFHGGLFTWLTSRPASQSHGVGLHDALNFYTLEHFRLDRPGAPSLADLFDFRLLVSSPREPLRALEPLELLFENERYRVSRLAGEGRSVTLMREGGELRGTPRGARPDVVAWMGGNGPEARTTLVLDVDDPRSRSGLTSAPAPRDTWLTFADASPPAGTVIWDRLGDASFDAVVALDEPALVVAKVGYHPFWRVTIDGAPAEAVFAFPGFVAVRCDVGVHNVRGEYRWPTYSRWLLLLMPLPLIVPGLRWGSAAASRRAR